MGESRGRLTETQGWMKRSQYNQPMGGDKLVRGVQPGVESSEIKAVTRTEPTGP